MMRASQRSWCLYSREDNKLEISVLYLLMFDYSALLYRFCFAMEVRYTCLPLQIPGRGMYHHRGVDAQMPAFTKLREVFVFFT